MQRPYELSLSGFRPGETASAVVEIQGERYGETRGRAADRRSRHRARTPPHARIPLRRWSMEIVLRVSFVYFFPDLAR